MNDQKTEIPDDSKSSGDNIEPALKKKASSKRAPVSPTLVAYFGPSPVSAVAFVKAVKATKISIFPEADVRDSSELMVVNDVDARRLCALVCQSRLPDVINRWIWSAVQQRLKVEIPGAFEADELDPTTTFKLIHSYLSPDLSSSDGPKRSRAEILLRMTMAWLISQRSLALWTVLEVLGSDYFRDASATHRSARRILTRGNIREIKEASSIAGLAQGIIRTAFLQKDQAERRQISLQSQLTSAQAEHTILRDEKAALEQEINGLAEQLASARSQLEESKQHWGHDMVDAKARQNTLLNSRLLPLLNDAVDALEIQPSAPEIALKRLKAALRSIQEAAQ